MNQPVVARDPWIISCESWFSQGKYIALPLNPEQIDFSAPLRVAHDDGYNAKFVYIWRRRRSRSMNGSMTISFALNSSNIIPQFDLSNQQKYDLASRYQGNVPPEISMAGDHRKGISEFTQASVKGIYDSAVPIGVSNLYALLSLADEPRIRSLKPIDVEDRLIGQQTSNRIIMAVSTLIFPRLLLYGWFTPDGISFSMNADNPAEFTVNFSMLVTGTNPRLGRESWQSLTESYRKNMYNSARAVDWMASTMHGRDPNYNLDTPPTFDAPMIGSSDLLGARSTG